MPRQFEVSIHKKVSERYPSAAYLVLTVTGLDLSGSTPEFYEAIQELTSEGVSSNSEDQAAEQIEYWKSIYKEMGLSRAKGVSSFESLYKRARKSGQLPVINPFVDLYNSICLNTRTCIGAYDAAKLQSNIELRFVDSDQEMFPIGDSEGLLVKRDSIAYYDEKGIICSYWNCRDANRTCIDSASRDIIVTIDVGTDPASAWRAAQLLSERAARLRGRTGVPLIVNSVQPRHLLNLTTGV